ncbi:MAG: NAD+ synthase [Desulfobacterales bacterium]|jgi:NAD+ synthase (glutamine-hydrolysing)
MKIALAQVNPIIGDFASNCARIRQCADQAVAQSCDLVVFSELVVSGYPPQDLVEKKDFVDANIAGLNRMLDAIRGIGVICGFVDYNPADEGKRVCNSAVLFEDGQILHQVHKRLLPTYDVFDESRYFEPGRESRSFVYKGLRIGLTICEDLWNDKDIFKRRIYHYDPVDAMVKDGAELIVNISASPFHTGKIGFRKNMHAAIAKKHGVPLVYVNQVGGNDSLLFDGLSAVFDRQGRMVARARDFAEDLIVYDTAAESVGMREVAASETEAVFKALVMGTRDYVTKCGFSKAVIGLSGGIDSALTAAIAACALGSENVTAVFMPSVYTSADNIEDTRRLAANLGVGLETIAIDELFGQFLKCLGSSLDDREPGTTEQNIQARIRGTILMAISNQRGCLLLSTGNKSELAVGYCTLYGDMSGGLAVISDVPKTMVYDLAHFINRDRMVIPERIISKPPSAELKADQRDDDDLPPYDVLDPILKGYIEDDLSLSELVALGFDRQLVSEIVAKVNRNEYKRYQAAPGLKVTSKAFGYGRRYPIAQRYAPS